MKRYVHIVGFFFAMLLSSVAAYGQTTLWSENFESYSTGFLTTGGFNNWKVIINTASNNVFNITGGSCVITGTRSLTIYDNYDGIDCYYNNSFDAADKIAYYYSSKVNATGYNTEKLNFKWKCVGEATYDYFYVLYSTDAVTWTKVSNTQYQGQSTTQTVSNLALPASLDGQQFYIGFQWINDNSGGSTPGLTIDDISVTGVSNCSTPTTQANSLTITPTCTQATVAWANGNGSKRVVLCKTANSFTDPVNGTDPTASSTYTASPAQQVVYNGTGNSVVVTGLTVGTTYWFKVYEANCSSTNILFDVGSGGANNPLSGTTTNVPGTPATPAGTANPCPNVSQTYSISPTATATSYTWTVPTGWSISAGASTATITVTTGTNGQNGNITVKAINACGTGASSAALAVTITVSTPNAGYDQYLCAGTVCTVMAATGTGNWSLIGSSTGTSPSIETAGSTTSVIGWTSGTCGGTGSGGTNLSSGTFIYRWTSTCGGAYDDVMIIVK